MGKKGYGSEMLNASRNSVEGPEEMRPSGGPKR